MTVPPTARRKTPCRRPRAIARRGYVLLDITIAMALLAACATVLVVARSGAAKLDRGQSDLRSATRAAEAYLATAPKTRPTTLPAGLTVTRLPTTAPAGLAWVRVETTVNGRRGEVVGLTRETP